MEQHYAILHIDDENLYWDHSWGWIKVEEDGEDTFSIFTEDETKTYELPPGGIWVTN